MCVPGGLFSIALVLGFGAGCASSPCPEGAFVRLRTQGAIDLNIDWTNGLSCDGWGQASTGTTTLNFHRRGTVSLVLADLGPGQTGGGVSTVVRLDYPVLLIFDECTTNVTENELLATRGTSAIHRETVFRVAGTISCHRAELGMGSVSPVGSFSFRGAVAWDPASLGSPGSAGDGGNLP